MNNNYEDLILEDLNGEEQATIAGGDGAAPQQPGFPGGGFPGGGFPGGGQQNWLYQLYQQQQYMEWLQTNGYLGGGGD